MTEARAGGMLIGMKFRLVNVLVLAALLTSFARAEPPTASELAQRRRWVAAKFEGVQSNAAEQPHLVVIENHDAVQKNARGGRPMTLAGKQHTRGLYCHANSTVVVKNLPAGAKTFTALVGVDSNDQTSNGRGSVVFIVRADGKELLKSGVTRESSAPMPLSVAVNGARELELIVTDAGDGIACDQADWVDARIELSDGSSIWLGDLPIDPVREIATDAIFSLKLDGKPFALSNPRRAHEKIDEERTRHRLMYKDAASKLIVRVEAVEYEKFPTVEWTVFVKNVSESDSGMIESLQAIDKPLYRDGGGEFVLHHSTGSPCLPTDYQPHDTPMPPQFSKRITTAGGRSTNSDLPFFNIEWGGTRGRGAIVGLGWPGQWAATFSRDSGNELRVVAGQELTHFRLKPGEEVRTPLVVMQFYDGGATRAQNVWRRWMIAHNMPHPNGKPVEPMTGACSSHQVDEMLRATEENQKQFVDRYLAEKIQLNYWWMDAGWYVNSGTWTNTGTWEVDTKRFPRGLRAVSDHMRAKGVKSLLWFEPERVNPGTKVFNEHPEFMLSKPDGGDKLLNLGDERARKWAIEMVDRTMTEQGIDLFRSDFNIDPLPYWRAADTEDRQGITEIRYAEGFLAYWDELHKRRPNLIIDTCASGGRRNDLETLRRAVPLLRSDYILEPVGQQNHTMGIARWLPYYGTGANSTDAYIFRSQMCPWFTACYDVRRTDLDYDALRKLHAQWKQIAPLFMKDFYPLTPYATENTAWVAWQFHDPEKGQGVIQAFRRSESFYEAASLQVQAVDEKARYVVSDLDNGKDREMSGAELSEGLSVALKARPAAALITYRRLP